MKRNLIFLILFLSVAARSPAQEDALWYFGTNAGLSFLPGIAPIYPMPLGNSAMKAPEGSAVACDSLGNLLFYTNGEVIYNRNHQVMSNGYNLAGHYSSFQAAVIVRVPNSSHLFYVFTADANENDYSRGYAYSIVDMEDDNGNGAVVLKNSSLRAPGSERLAAVRHVNNIDVWIVTNDFDSNVFRVWLLTCNGLSANPVVSTSGEKMNGDRYMNIGAVKISPDGTTLCQTHFPDLGKTKNFFQIFDFNKATGIVSNPRRIAFDNTLYFGAEFSPDSKLLYLTKGSGGSEIDQFGIAADANGIAASRVIIPAAKGLFGMQLAPDNKIYVAKEGPKLGVIDYPNIKGPACQVVIDKIDLGGGIAGLNFPSRINDYIVKNFTYTILDSCRGIVQFYGVNSLGNGIDWRWDFGDGGSSTEQNPIHVFTGATTSNQVVLTLTSAGTCGFISKTQFIVQGGLIARAAFEYTQDCDSSFISFQNTSVLYPDTAGRYLWEFGSADTTSVSDPEYHYSSVGDLSVKLKIITGTGCRDDSVTHVISIHKLDIKAPRDQSINEGETVILYTTGGGTRFAWTPADWLSDPSSAAPRATPPQDMTYIVSATDDYGCSDKDTVNVKVFDLDGIYVPTAFTPNNDALNDNMRPFLGLNYSLVDFSIFNRWGEKVFGTKENGKGWNGIYKGLPQAGDAFVWTLVVKDQSGTIIRRNGSFVLVR